MDQTQAPLVEALADYHREDRYGFTPPGYRQGRGADPRTRDVLGEAPYRSDVLASAGLDDRSSSGGFLKAAETANGRGGRRRPRVLLHLRQLPVGQGRDACRRRRRRRRRGRR